MSARWSVTVGGCEQLGSQIVTGHERDQCSDGTERTEVVLGDVWSWAGITRLAVAVQADRVKPKESKGLRRVRNSWKDSWDWFVLSLCKVGGGTK